MTTGLHRLHWALLVVALVSLPAGCADAERPAGPLPDEEPAPQPPPVSPPADPSGPPRAHIYLADATGEVIVRLTAGDAPAWSPDSRRIAFHRDGHVRVISATGSGEVQLAQGESPTWASDGARIAFTNTAGLSVMNADGSAVRTLVPHDFRDDTYKPWDLGVGKPAFSPDGARIAFEHLGDGDIQPAQVYVVGSDGAAPRRLVALPSGVRYAESDPSWSPDGSKIAFWSYGFGIAVVDAAGGVPNGIFTEFPAVAYGAKPAWSADGRAIAFNRRSGMARSLWVVAASGGPARLYIPDAYDAAWSPDGSRLAFVSTRNWP